MNAYYVIWKCNTWEILYTPLSLPLSRVWGEEADTTYLRRDKDVQRRKIKKLWGRNDSLSCKGLPGSLSSGLAQRNIMHYGM